MQALWLVLHVLPRWYKTLIEYLELEFKWVYAGPVLKFLITKRNSQVAYGSTETSPVVNLMYWDDSDEKRTNTVGKTLDHIEVRVNTLLFTTKILLFYTFEDSRCITIKLHFWDFEILPPSVVLASKVLVFFFQKNDLYLSK